MSKTNFEKRCEDCACLIKKGGKLCCEECFGQLIEEIDDCPLGVTLEQIVEIEKTAKENKVKTVNTSGEKKERKPRERKVDVTKVDFIQKIFTLANTFGENAAIVKPEREISFDFNGESYSIQLVKHRKAKAK